MTKARLTDLSIRQLPFTESGQKRYFDETTPGFGVTVGTRTKTFMVVYGEKRTMKTLGQYPTVSLQDARKEAKRLLATATAPSADISHHDALQAYLEDCRERLRPRTVEEYARPLRLGPNMPLSEYTKRTIEASDPHVIMAWKVYFNWCVKHDLTDKNPFQYKTVKYGERSRVLTDDEIKAIWQYDYPPFSDIIKLCLLTGQRKNEVASFNDSWIKRDTITIPGTVAKNHNEHTFPFNLLTAKYLKRYCGQSFNGWSKGKARLDKHIPLPHWTIHDLRRTYSTTMARLGVPLHITEALLNHRSGTISGVARTYNRYTYLTEQREAILTYEAHIATIVGATGNADPGVRHD